MGRTALPSIGRRKKQQQSTRTYSSEEQAAWSRRPLGCNDLTEALRHHRDKKEAEKLSPNSWEHVPKQKPVANFAEWCYRHEHPLRTGRKGKIYHRTDFMGPIIDCLRDLKDDCTSDAFGLSEYIASKRQKVKKEERRPPKSEEPAYAFTCRGCGNHDHGKLILGHEGYTCPCGVWAGNQIVSSNRQKLGAAEDEDKTITADRPWESKTDKYDRGPETAKEARTARMDRAKTSGGLGGRRAGMHMGRLCDVMAMSEREAAKNIVEAEVAAGIALMPRDRVKQRSVLSHVEEIFKLLSPVDHEVRRAVRIAADKTYVAAVQHCNYCQRRDLCEVRLSERHAAAIAQAVFEHTVDKLIEQDGNGERIDMSRLADLQVRMHRTTLFTTRTSATQIASSKLMVEIINSSDFDFKKHCEPCESDMPAMPSNLAPVAGPPIVSSLTGCKGPATLRPLASPCLLQRSLSICSNGEASPTPSKQIEWRNAISAIFVAHRAELQTSVRDSALRVIQVPAFIKACEAEPKVKNLSDNQLAFCLLNAVALEQMAADTLSFSKNIRPNAGIADKIDIGLIVADEAIGCIRAAMPADVASDQSEREADDLFQ